MDVEKTNSKVSYPFHVFFAPQDSDGDKSEDNLVVDVSNEVRRVTVINYNSTIKHMNRNM